MSDAKKVLKNSGIYGIVSILQKSVGFILLPVYAHYLSTTDYGITAVVGSVVSFFSIFYMLSLNGAISRYYFIYKDDEEQLKEFWGTNILFVMLNCLVLTILLILFRKFLIMPFVKGIVFSPYIVLALISITLNPIFSIFQCTLQTEQNGKKYGVNNFSYFMVNLILIICFVVIFKMKAEGVLLAASITDMIFFVYTLIDFVPRVKLTINKKYLKESLTYSLPLLPHSLAGWAMAAVDKIFLNNMKNASAAGVYNIGYQFGNIIYLVTNAVNQAFVPWFFEKMDSGNKGKNMIIKFSEYAIVGYGSLALIISLFGKDVLSIMVTKDFSEGWKVVPLICFAYVFNGIYYFFANPLFYNKKGPKYIPIGTFSSALINILLNYLLVPKYGMIGSSVASLVSMFISSIIVLYISNRIEKVDYNCFKLYGITFLFLIVSMISYINFNLSYMMVLALKFLILLGIYGILSFLYKKEFIYIKRYVVSYVKGKL